jgi:hypothetical protein
MNCALRKRALVAGVVLVIGLTGGLVIRGVAGSDQPPDVSKTDKQAGNTAAGDGPTRPAADRPGTAEESVETPAAKTGDRAGSADERRRLLETVGSLAVAHCYQSYVNIGLLADARAKGLYAQKDAAKVLDSVLALLDSVDRKLAALDNLDLDKQDRSSLDQMRVISTLLHQQGQELQVFWDSGADENAARYEDVRKDSWAAISRLTGIGR